jgi:hypothetical protein
MDAQVAVVAEDVQVVAKPAAADVHRGVQAAHSQGGRRVYDWGKTEIKQREMPFNRYCLSG